MSDLEKRNELRDFLHNAEGMMAEMPQVEMPPEHYFAKNLYGRKIDIPQGTCLVGKIHKHQSLNVLLKGDISILTENGVKRIQAPYVVVSDPGIKRMGYAHADCSWLCVHGTEETELEMIEKDVIAEIYEDVEYLDHQIKEFLEFVEKED